MQSGLHDKYWDFAAEYSIYTCNRIPNKSIRNIYKVSPYEVALGHKPKIKHLRPFGCFCIAWIHNSVKWSTKITSKGEACRFLGYSQESNGYVLLRIRTNEIIVRKAVKFFENVFSNEAPPLVNPEILITSESEHVLSEFECAYNDATLSEPLLQMKVPKLLVPVPLPDEALDKPIKNYPRKHRKVPKQVNSLVKSRLTKIYQRREKLNSMIQLL